MYENCFLFGEKNFKREIYNLRYIFTHYSLKKNKIDNNGIVE